MAHPSPNDLVLLISPDRKRFLALLAAGDALHTHRGIVQHDDVLATPIGGTVRSHNDQPFTLLRPSMEEVLLTVRRATQIVYPKDIGYILLKLSIHPGVRVIEAGTGSGGLTTALARYVTPGGHVYSYEVRAEMSAVAQTNLTRVGLADSVTFHLRDIEEGFVERDVDALFLDVREPWLYLDAAGTAMADGAFFGSLVPTVNQVSDLLAGLESRPFTDLEVCEVMLRQYKPVHDRLRPQDRLTAHTGFLVFARRLLVLDGAPEETGAP